MRRYRICYGYFPDEYVGTATVSGRNIEDAFNRFRANSAGPPWDILDVEYERHTREGLRVWTPCGISVSGNAEFNSAREV